MTAARNPFYINLKKPEFYAGIPKSKLFVSPPAEVNVPVLPKVNRVASMPSSSSGAFVRGGAGGTRRSPSHGAQTPAFRFFRSRPLCTDTARTEADEPQPASGGRWVPARCSPVSPLRKSARSEAGIQGQTTPRTLQRARSGRGLLPGGTEGLLSRRASPGGRREGAGAAQSGSGLGRSHTEGLNPAVGLPCCQSSPLRRLRPVPLEVDGVLVYAG